MASAPTFPVLSSSFISSCLNPSFYLTRSLLPSRTRRSPSYIPIRALELDQNTVVAISVGVVSLAVGIGIPVFYETQIDNSAKRDNKQPCFPCNGSGAQQCRFCIGKGTVTVALGGGENESSQCINCEGAGTLTCTTCQGSGIQPRYLDRRYISNAPLLSPRRLRIASPARLTDLVVFLALLVDDFYACGKSRRVGSVGLRLGSLACTNLGGGVSISRGARQGKRWSGCLKGIRQIKARESGE